LTEKGEVVLVKQFRFGIEAVTLEIPGGHCGNGANPVGSRAERTP
jgi:8-oxo-dGTP pyrophosphatase MutT (NUDIX family)